MPPKAAKTAPKAAPAKAKTAPAAAKKPAAPKAQPRAGSGNGVYVKDWANGSVEEAINIFQKAGAVQSAFIRRHKYALVFFENAAAVKKAIDLFDGKMVLGAKVTVQAARTSPKPDPKATSATVFVSPVFRGSCNKQQIMQLFAGYKVEHMTTHRQNYVYAYFDSHATAERFLKEKNGSEFLGHKLRVELSAKTLEKVKAHRAQASLLMKAHRMHKAQTHVAGENRGK